MDPYVTLGVSRTATQNEIKAAYRKLAKKLHPDLNPGNKVAEKQFKDVSAAYEILEDPVKRAKFDHGESEPDQGGARQGPSKQGPFYYETQRGGGGRYTQSFDEDLFKNFGDLFGRARAEPQEDLRVYRMEVDFKDAVLGAEREVTLPEGRKLQIKIPPGVESGQKLRLKGFGEIELHVRESPVFHRNGRDIEIEIPVSLSEAILGAEIRVPTVDGAVLLKIPPSSNSGTRLRIRGKGVGASGLRGDEIVTLTVVLPETTDADLRDKIAEWSLTHSYNPREKLENTS